MMLMAKLEPIKVMGFKCQRCGHEWVPHDPENPPRTCPKCKSPFWDRKRRNSVKGTGS
jgi:predicted Zn-ribbon and HTH transcriptional regulator